MGARPGLVILAMCSVLLTQPARAQEATFGDLQYIKKALNAALETARSGTKTTWENPETGHHGVIVPSPLFESDSGRICRGFERTWINGSAVPTYEGTACREAKGLWRIRQERRVPARYVAPAPEPVSDDAVRRFKAARDPTAEAQRLLNQLWFDTGPVDGVPGPKTRKAIETFQNEQGLSPDGQVSDGLLARLRATVQAPPSESGITVQRLETPSERPTEVVARQRDLPGPSGGAPASGLAAGQSRAEINDREF